MPSRIDFGQVARDKALVGTVKLQNIGHAPLVVTSVDSSCECTAATPAKKLLAPGEETELSVRVESHAVLGALRRSVTVRTNANAVTIPVDFVVVAEGNWNLEQFPAMVPANFSSRETHSEIAVLYRGTERAEIERIVSTEPWLRAEVLAATPGRTMVRLTRLAGAPAGNHVVLVKATTNDPTAPEIPLHVIASVYPDLVLLPNPITVSSAELRKASGVTLRLVHWLPATMPRFELPGGRVTLVAVGMNDEGICFKAELSETTAGMADRQLRIYDGSELLMSVPIHVIP